MLFEWLTKFHHDEQKPEDYAEKTLAAYRLGIKAKGSIAGVIIETAEGCCAAARALPIGMVYHPNEAPRLPLENCPFGRKCRCVYRPKMTYQEDAP
jgi:hypothetical protein